MEPGRYLDHIREDGAALAAAAFGHLDRQVPSCPDWDIAALVRHVGAGHRWFANIVRRRATEGHWTFEQGPDDLEVLISWYEGALADVVDALRETTGDELVWNWYVGEPAPVCFWHRRVAQETAIHRWDVQAAAGTPTPLDPGLAADGIDEYLDFVDFSLRVNPIDGLVGSLHLHATDTDGEWLVSLSPGGVSYARTHARADTGIRGPISDLLLWLENRVPADAPALDVFGDRRIIDGWRAVRF